MNVSGKYLKEESGNIISPVVSIDTTYHGTTKLSTIVNKRMAYTLLFEGSTTGDISLPFHAFIFEMMRIFYYVTVNSGYCRKSVNVSNPDNSTVLLNCFYTPEDCGRMINTYKMVFISGNGLYNQRMGYVGCK